MTLSISPSTSYDTYFMTPPNGSIEHIKSLNLNDEHNFKFAINILSNKSPINLEELKEFINHIKKQGLFSRYLNLLSPILMHLPLDHLQDEISTLTHLPLENIWEFINHKKHVLCHCDEETLKLLVPLLDKLTEDQLIELISCYNKLVDEDREMAHHGDKMGILNDGKKYSIIISILLNKTPEFVEKIITCKAWQNNVHKENRFLGMFPLLKKKFSEGKTLIDILFSNNNGLTYMHKYFIHALPLIKNLINFKDLIRTDSRLKNALHFWLLNFLNDIPWRILNNHELHALEGFENELIEILSHVDVDLGVSILQKPNVFPMLMPFFEKLPLNLLTQLFHAEDGFGNIILNDPELSQQTASLREKL